MPLPPLDGVSRPQQPQILSAVRAAGVPGAVDIELAGSYSDRVEYRWWPHGGSGPAGGFAEWRAAPVSSGTFRVSGVRPVGSVFADLPSVALFDFEVRLVDADGIPGEPSGVVVTLVGLTPGMPRPAPAVYGLPLPPLDVGFPSRAAGDRQRGPGPGSLGLGGRRACGLIFPPGRVPLVAA